MNRYTVLKSMNTLWHTHECEVIEITNQDITLPKLASYLGENWVRLRLSFNCVATFMSGELRKTSSVDFLSSIDSKKALDVQRLYI